MSRRRYISTDVSIDKRLNRLASEHGDFAALLYSWMIPHATDEATLNGDLDEFMATVIPMRRDKTAAEVTAALRAMCSVGLIQWDGETIYLPTQAFYRYQTYIKVENRRVGDVAVGERTSPENSEQQRGTADNAEGKAASADLDSAAENAEERRGTPENAVSLSLSSSVSLPLSSSVSAAPLNGAGKRQKPATVLKPLTDEQRERIELEFADIPHLQDEIAFALQHTAHSKATDDNLYLRHWLRKTREQRPERSNGNGGAHPRRSTVLEHPDDEDPLAKRLRLDAERRERERQLGVS